MIRGLPERKSPCVRTNSKIVCGEETSHLRRCTLNYIHGDAAYRTQRSASGCKIMPVTQVELCGIGDKRMVQQLRTMAIAERPFSALAISDSFMRGSARRHKTDKQQVVSQ